MPSKFKGLFTSNTPVWSTPQDFFDKANAEFGPFTLDPCANPDNAKCTKFFTEQDDGLAQDWSNETVWLNPPYGATIGLWLKKAAEASKNSTVVCLVPARTDTRWFHDYCAKADLIRFLKGRLKFGGGTTAAPFPSVLVVFKNKGQPGHRFEQVTEYR